MRISKLLKVIEEMSNEIAEAHPITTPKELKAFKVKKGSKQYHITVQFYLSNKPEIIRQLVTYEISGNKEPITVPKIDIDVDLENDTDEHIMFIVSDLFCKYSTWLSNLERNASQRHKYVS